MIRINPLALAAIVALAVAFSVGASAVRRPSPPVPPVIAVVDLPRALQGLDERVALEAQIQARADEFKTRIENISNELKKAESDLEFAQPADRRAIEENILRLRIRREAELQVSERLINMHAGKVLGDLYTKMINSTEELAKQSGYTLVLTKDAPIDRIPEDAKAVEQVAKMRRILYYEDGHDVTQELIDFMNNRYAAGK